MKILTVIRRFERFNFQGVTELPEPMYQRDNYAHYSERLTGKSITNNRQFQSQGNPKLIGYISDDRNNRKESFMRVISKDSSEKINNSDTDKKKT